MKPTRMIIATVALLTNGHAFAWDGTVTGRILGADVTDGPNENGRR